MYFKAAKLNAEKSEAEENLVDYLEALQLALNCLPAGDPLKKNAETICDKVPLEWKEHMRRRSVSAHQMADGPTEKSLIRLHRQVGCLLIQAPHNVDVQ